MLIFLRIMGMIWASPNTLLGIFIGFLGLLSGGRARIRNGCLEFYGGLTTFFLKKTPIQAVAMTLGHTILGQSPELLDSARDHEHVHVRQYEKWGPLFLPAYFACWFVLWVQGKDAYRLIPFEVEAYSKTEIGSCDHTGQDRSDES